MNEYHLQFCSSPEWARTVAEEILPWAIGGRDLGARVLEIGPGPGITTAALRERIASLACLEIDPQLAAALAERFPDVDVVCADASAMPWKQARFSAVVTFTMLHHVPERTLQDAVFSEARRVLLPGGLFVGTDSLDTEERRAQHADDVFVPLDPATLGDRLSAAGFNDVVISVANDRVLFAGSV